MSIYERATRQQRIADVKPTSHYQSAFGTIDEVEKDLEWQSVSPLTSAPAEALYRKDTTGPATSSMRASACRLGRVFPISGSV
jgi:hypothetical protein